MTDTAADIPNRFAPGTFSVPSRPARLGAMLLAQTRMELSLFLRNGEQLLVAIIIPVCILIGLSRPHIGSIPDPRVAHATTAVLAIAVMSTAFTGQAIAVGFDRRYGALKRLGGTPLPPRVVIGGKSLAVLILVAGQAVVLGALGAAMGWRPDALGLVAAVPVLILGTFTFSAMGLLLGGTLKAEIVLALANLIWFFLMGAAALAIGIADLPGRVHDVLVVIPSYALTSALEAAFAGTVPAVQMLVLVVWGGLCAALAARTFSFT